MGRDIVEAIPNDDGIEIDQTLSLSRLYIGYLVHIHVCAFVFFFSFWELIPCTIFDDCHFQTSPYDFDCA